MRRQIARTIVLSRTDISRVIHKDRLNILNRFTESLPEKNSAENCGLAKGKPEETSITLQEPLSSHSIFQVVNFSGYMRLVLAVFSNVRRAIARMVIKSTWA